MYLTFRKLHDGDKFQFTDGNYSIAEYEKVDAAHFRLARVGYELIRIDDYPRGMNEPVIRDLQDT